MKPGIFVFKSNKQHLPLKIAQNLTVQWADCRAISAELETMLKKNTQPYIKE